MIPGVLEVHPHRCRLPRLYFRREGKLAACLDCGELSVVRGNNSDFSIKEWVKLSKIQENYADRTARQIQDLKEAWEKRCEQG